MSLSGFIQPLFVILHFIERTFAKLKSEIDKMINSKALAIALTLGVATVASGAANASSAKSPAEFQTMIDSIHAKQALNRADIKNKLTSARTQTTKGPLSPAAFQKMIENIHTKQAMNRARVMEIVKKSQSGTKQLASR